VVGAALVGTAVVGAAVVGTAGVADLADATFVAAGDAALFVFVGAAGAVGAMFAAGADGVANAATEVPLVPGVVWPTGAAFASVTFATNSA
jgi:hypothetical protein